MFALEILATLLLPTLVFSSPVLQNDVPQNASSPAAAPAPNAPAQPPSQDSSNTARKIGLPSRSGFQLATGAINTPKLLHAINATLLKYNSPFQLPPFKDGKLNVSALYWGERHKRQAEVDLTDDNDLLYSAPISIGSQNQQFIMDFDTGSSDIVIPGPRCNAAAGCTRPTKYQNTGTLTQSGAKYVYGGGAATGDEYTDSVTVANLTVQKQGLMSVSSAPFFATGDNNYDGLFGMAFTGASGSNQTTFMQNLINSTDAQLPAPEFSFYLGRSFNGTTGAQSQLTLGGRDHTKYSGAVLNIPVVNETAWIVGLDSISIAGRPAGAAGLVSGLAGIDTGTSFIVVPSSTLAPIFALIPSATPIPFATTGSNNLIMYAYPCSTPAKYMPTIHLNGTARAAPFAIDPQDFSLGFVDGDFATALAEQQGVTAQVIADRGLCLASLLGVKDNVNPDLFVLGTPFLKGWYSVFNFGSGGGAGEKGGPYVGFANSVNCGGVGC